VLRLSTRDSCRGIRQTRRAISTGQSLQHLRGGGERERGMRIVTKGNEAGMEAARSEIGAEASRRPTARRSGLHVDTRGIKTFAASGRDGYSCTLSERRNPISRIRAYLPSRHELGTTRSLQRRGEQTEIPINHPVTSREPRRGLLLRISQ